MEELHVQDKWTNSYLVLATNMILIVYIHIPSIIFHSVSKNMWQENILQHESGLLAHAMGTLIAQGAALAVMLILRIHVYPRGLAEPSAVTGFH